MSTVLVKYENVCMKLRHDFGLLSNSEQQEMINNVGKVISCYLEELNYQQNKKKYCKECKNCKDDYNQMYDFQGCMIIGADNRTNQCEKFCERG